MDGERISLRLEPEDLELLDDFIAKHPEYSNRSNFARVAIRSFIEQFDGIVDGIGAWAYNNWPDAATNNHGKEGGNIAFLDGHVSWVTHKEWVPTHLKSAHGAWPEELARKTYFPNLRKEPRTDGGKGYIWYIH